MAVVLFFSLVPFPMNTETLILLEEPGSTLTLTCDGEYRVSYEKLGILGSTAVGSVPEGINLQDLCGKQVRLRARPRFLYGRVLCPPEATECSRRTLVLDVTEISL